MRFLRLSSVIAGLAVAAAVAAAPAHAVVPDPDENSAAPTGWHWYAGVSPSSVSAHLDADKERLVSIHVEGVSPLRLSVATVSNSGTYGRRWWWYHGLTADQLAARVRENRARITDIDRYVDGGREVFAAIMVENSGDAAKAWWWYTGQTAEQVTQNINANRARLVAIDSYDTPRGRLYSVAMIANEGVDAAAWWWYLNVTPDEVSRYMSENKARVVDLNWAGNGRYNVVMIGNTGAGGQFTVVDYKDEQAIGDLIRQNVVRIYGIERVFNTWAVAMIDNSHTDEARIRAQMLSGWRGGVYGAYIKRVGGPVLLAMNENRVMEPGSALKVLPLLYAIRSRESLTSTRIAFKSCPGSPKWDDSGKCAGQQLAAGICVDNRGASATYTTSLRVALLRMMQVSDNRTTEGVIDHYGRATINRWADDHGIGADTEIRRRFGCAGSNQWTLNAAGKLYEGVIDGSLASEQQRKDLFNLMSQDTAGGAGLNRVIAQEAAMQGKSAIADDFEKLVVRTGKGGGDSGRCVPGAPPGCVFNMTRAGIGQLKLPVKTRLRKTTYRYYAFGWFANNLSIPCADVVPPAPPACDELRNALSTTGPVYEELARPAVRQALRTW